MKTLQASLLSLSLFLLSSISYGQTYWKHVKVNTSDPNNESVMVYLAKAEIPQNRTIVGGGKFDDNEKFSQILTLLDAEGNVLIDTIPNRPNYGIIYIQPIANTNTFMTIAVKLEELDFIKTVYDYNFKKLNESKIFTNTTLDNQDFVYKESKLSNGNTILSGPISRGGILYFIISPDGTIVKKDIIITDKPNYNILESFDGNKNYIFGESIIELDSNFDVQNVINEELPLEDDEYGFSATKFSDLYVVHNMVFEEGPVITTFDHDFNIVNEIYNQADSVQYEYAGAPFNSLVAQDSFLFTGFTKYDVELGEGRMYIRKYNTKFKLVSETILFDSLYQFSIVNLSSASDCGIYLTAFGEFSNSNNLSVNTAVFKLNCDGSLSSTQNPEKEIIVGYTLYPNPSSGEFNISLHNLEGEVEIEFYDITGKNIMRKSIQGNSLNSLDLSSLKMGTYVYHITKGGSLLSSGKWLKN